MHVVYNVQVQLFKSIKNMETMHEGDILEVKASDPGFMKDIKTWAEKNGQCFIGSKQRK